MARKTPGDSKDVALPQFFSEVLFGDEGYVELRALPSGHRAFFHPDDDEGIEAFRIRHQEENLFFGVAKRRHPTDGKLPNCWTIDAFWADIDFRDRPEAEARRQLDTFAHEPNCVVNSGGGLHCYWVLNEPADVRASEPRIRNILRRLGRAVGGDLSSAEPARVLRVPGTYNYKYSPPRRVTIERFALERTYSIADLEETLPAEPDRQSGRRGLVVPPEIRDGERNSMLFRTSRSCAFRKF